MADPWVTLLIRGTVLLVGSAASLAFQRFRVPDFILLLLLIGAQSGLLPATDVSLLLGALPAALLLAAMVCASLLVWAGPSAGAADAVRGAEPSLPANGR